MRRSELHKAQSLVAQAIGRPEVLRRIDANRILKRWEECVGEQLASKSEPERFENGTLWVAVASSVWVQELQLRKSQILERLNEAANTDLFVDIRFGVRAFQKVSEGEPEKGPETVEPEEIDIEFSVPEIEAVARPALGKMKALSKRDK